MSMELSENVPDTTEPNVSSPAPENGEPTNGSRIEVPRLPPEQIKDPALEILGTLLKMLQFETEFETEISNQNLRIRIKCEDAGRLIGRGGNTLNGLQFLLNRMVYRRCPGAPRIYLDVEGFKEQMDSEVLKRADAAAEQVRRWGESLELAAMSSYDRRVIHQHFANDPEIVVESVGDEQDQKFKKMVLRLRK